MFKLNKNAISSLLIFLSAFIFLVVPGGWLLAQGGDSGFLPIVSLDCEPPDCGFEDLVDLARNVLAFLIFVSIMLAVAMFVYAGFVYVTAAGSEERIKQAHGVFKKVAIGFLIVLAAWLIIDMILSALTSDGIEEWIRQVTRTSDG